MGGACLSPLSASSLLVRRWMFLIPSALGLSHHCAGLHGAAATAFWSLGIWSLLHLLMTGFVWTPVASGNCWGSLSHHSDILLDRAWRGFAVPLTSPHLCSCTQLLGNAFQKPRNPQGPCGFTLLFSPLTALLGLGVSGHIFTLVLSGAPTPLPQLCHLCLVQAVMPILPEPPSPLGLLLYCTVMLDFCPFLFVSGAED